MQQIELFSNKSYFQVSPIQPNKKPSHLNPPKLSKTRSSSTQNLLFPVHLPLFLQQNFYNLIVIEAMEERQSNSPKKHQTESLTQCSNPLNSPSLSFSKEPPQSSQSLPNYKILFPTTKSTSISSQNQPNTQITINIYGHRTTLNCSQIQQVQNGLKHLSNRLQVHLQVWISIKLVLLRHLSQQNSLFSELYFKTLEQYSNAHFDQINSAL